MVFGRVVRCSSRLAVKIGLGLTPPFFGFFIKTRVLVVDSSSSPTDLSPKSPPRAATALPPPAFVTSSSSLPPSPPSSNDKPYDITILGGTLGIVLAASLQSRGLSVCVVERGLVQGREQVRLFPFDALHSICTWSGPAFSLRSVLGKGASSILANALASLRSFGLAGGTRAGGRHSMALWLHFCW